MRDGPKAHARGYFAKKFFVHARIAGRRFFSLPNKLYIVCAAMAECLEARGKMSGKRKDYISWDEYFMGVAILSGMRSKDPNTQVGACIVSEDHKILSMGYNGFPTGCSDDVFPWNREGEPLENKYFYTTHSELNAILNYRGGSLEGATIYVTLFPCNECAKAIIQSGIRRIVYDSDKYEKTPAFIASRRMLKAAGVKLQQYEHTDREVNMRL